METKKEPIPYLSTGDSLKALELLTKIGQPDCVVEDPVCPVIVGIGTADYTNHRQILTVRAGNSIDHAQSTNRERNRTGANSSRPSIAIGGVPGVELVATADQVELWLSDQVVQESQVEVAGDGEDVLDADLHKPPSQMTTQRAREGGWTDRQGSGAWESRGADLSRCIHFQSKRTNFRVNGV